MLPALINNKRFPDALKYLIIFVPVVIYFGVVLKYTVNVPLWDDYEVILHFLCRWKTAHSLDSINLIFEQQNEHRIVVSKLMYLFYYYTTGTVNFYNLALIGNVQLVAAFIIFSAFIRRCLPRHWFIASLALSLCMFDLNNWQNANFAMASMENYGVFLFFLASLWFYGKPGKMQLAAAILLQLCCMYSSGNGLIASAFLFLFTMLNKYQMKSIASGSTFIIFSALYFVHYQSPPSAPLLGSTKMINYFFHFAGGYFEEGYFTLPVAVGVVFCMCLWLLVPVGKMMQLNRQALPLICILGFILASMLSAAVLRSNVVEYIPSRYRIYSDILPALFLALLLIRTESKKTGLYAGIAMILLIVTIYCRDFTSSLFHFRHQHDIYLSYDYYYDKKQDAITITSQACQLKIYCIDEHRQAKNVF